MGVERLQEIAEELRGLTRFLREDNVYIYVEQERDEYEFDLGDFGYRSTTVSLSDDEYQVDPEAIFNDAPVSIGRLEDFADELEDYKDEADLDTVLAQMEQNGDGSLVAAIRSLVESLRPTVVSTGALPLSPLPWPGARVPGIDYTAEDFPLRYQPPPGFDWNTTGKNSSGTCAFDKVVRIAQPSAEGVMLLDKFGRVSWYRREGDELDGPRWGLWHVSRDGIPAAAGFSSSSPAREIDADGLLVGDPDGNWSDPERFKEAQRRIVELRAQAPQPVNEYGVSYDPFTVELDAPIRTQTTELRVGDYVNSYGRVLKVERAESEQFLVTFAQVAVDKQGRPGAPPILDTRGNFDWYMSPIKGRDNQPTALSLSEAKTAYDPLTIDVSSDSRLVAASELRVGDDVLGFGFGRVLKVEQVGDSAKITMNRDGKTNIVEGFGIEQEWQVSPIIGVDRSSQPTALSLSTRGTPGDYNPLTVDLQNETTTSRTSELRLGDDITGKSYGRVVGVTLEEGVYKVTMNRDGETNVVQSMIDENWEIRPIVARDSAPAALQQQPVAF